MTDVGRKGTEGFSSTAKSATSTGGTATTAEHASDECPVSIVDRVQRSDGSLQALAALFAELPHPSLRSALVGHVHKTRGNHVVQAMLQEVSATPAAPGAPSASVAPRAAPMVASEAHQHGHGSLMSAQAVVAPSWLAAPSLLAVSASPTSTAATSPAAQPIAPSNVSSPAQQADFPTVVTAAADVAIEAELDLSWIDSLPAYVKDSIDREFAKPVQDATLAKQGSTKQRAAHFVAAKKALTATTRKRLQASHAASDDAAILADGDYQQALAALTAQHAATDKTARAAFDASAVPRGKIKETVAEPPDGASTQVTRRVGQMATRTNFMAKAVSMFGSAEAAKTHFASIRLIPNSGGLWLAGVAAHRFELASAEFERVHPGYQFPDSDVGQSMRGLHEARNGVGMNGHALGVAFDLKAFENPNQKTADERFMLRRFGGTTVTGADGSSAVVPGRTMIDLNHAGGDAAVEALGKATVAGQATPAGRHVMDTIAQQFDEMAATSDRVRASLARNLPTLQAVRATYLTDVMEAGAELAQQAKQKALAKAIAQAAKDLPYPVFPKGTSAEVIKEEKAKVDRARLNRVKELEPTLGVPYAEGMNRVETATVLAEDNIKTALKPWTDDLTQQKQESIAGGSDDERKAAPALKACTTMVSTITRLPERMPILKKFAVKNIRVLGVQPDSADAATYKAQLLARAETLRHAANARDEAAVYDRLLAKLGQLPFVLGRAVYNQRTAHYQMVGDVVSPPVIQYAELGFVEHDEMPAKPAGSRATTEVFNRDVMVTLAKYGFSPGSTYGDTMHFDFVEGYGAVPGGRSKENMQSTRFGPKGKI